MTELTTHDRNKIDDGAFIFPQECKQPLENVARLGNVIARFNPVTNVGDAEDDGAWKRITTAATEHGVEVKEKNWRKISKV